MDLFSILPIHRADDGSELVKIRVGQEGRRVEIILKGLQQAGHYGSLRADGVLLLEGDTVFPGEKLMFEPAVPKSSVPGDDPRAKKQKLDANFTHPNLQEDLKQRLDQFLTDQIYLPHEKLNDVDVPYYGGRPSLLLHRLCNQNTERFDHFLKTSSRFVMMVGPSGAGKTRTLYSHLSRNFGFFLVCNELGNGGSGDIREMMNFCRQFFGDNRVQNADVVVFAVTLLLLARLEIFLHCKMKEVTPKKWLILQAACRKLFKDGLPVHGMDIFKERCEALFEANRECFQTGKLADAIRSARMAIKNLTTNNELPLIVLDEAQLISVVNQEQGKFWSEFPYAGVYLDRPLAKPVLEALYNPLSPSVHTVLFAGTGFTLYFQRNELNSTVAKPISEDHIYSGFGGWATAEEMVDYAKDILKIDSRVEAIIRDEIFLWFRGRFRPFVTLVEEVIIQSKGIDEIWKSFIDELTTDFEGCRKNFYKLVADIDKEIRGPSPKYVTKHNVIATLLEATTQYFYFGRALGFPFKRDSTLLAMILETSVGRLRSSDCLVIDEPLPLWGMLNYFTDSGQIKLSLNVKLNGLNYASAEGLFWQHLVPSDIFEWWKKYDGIMSKMDLFKDVELPNDLESLKHMSSTIVEGTAWNGGPPIIIYQANGEYSSLHYLKDEKPRCRFLVCEDSAGCDIMWRVKFESGMIILCSCQLKLRNKIGNPADALRKAAPVGAERTRLWNYSMLCLLVAYPASRGHLPLIKTEYLSSGRRSKCTLVVDKTNAHLLFEKEHLDNLNYLKESKEILIDVCGTCGKSDDGQNGADVQWIVCDVCLQWYHCACVHVNPEKIPDSYECSQSHMF